MTTPKKVKSICVPLDPDDCGSVISGYVRFPELTQNAYGKRLWSMQHGAEISLSDCSRVIKWQMSDTDGYNLAKLDLAIGALMKMREFMLQAQKDVERMEAEMKARNKILDPKGSES